MFLWVGLQILSLYAMRTDVELRKALLDLPKHLPETFSRILVGSTVKGQNYQRRILELFTIAQRPLNVNEIQEALSVIPGNTTWNRSTMLKNVLSTLACCGSLLDIDEEDFTIRLVHYSVKQYLIAGTEVPASAAFNASQANRNVLDIILTRLNYGVFGTEVSRKVFSRMENGTTPYRTIHSTLASSRSARDVALR